MNVHAKAHPEAASVDPVPLRNPFAGLTGELDPRRLISGLRRRMQLALGVGAVVLILVLAITLTATPKYTASASVMLDPRREQVVSSEAVLSGLTPDTAVVDTEVEVLKSRQLAERVMRSLQLDRDPEFNAALRKPTWISSATTALKAALRGGEKADQLTPVQIQRRRDAVVDAVLDGLSVRRLGLTYVISIDYAAQDQAKAALIANKYAELYLLEQMQAKFDATQQATRWLNDRLGELRQQVLTDESAVQQYKIANNLMSASGTNLTEQEISNYNLTLSQARAQVAEDEARLSTARRQLAAGSSGDDVGEALNSPVISQLRSQRAEVSRNVAALQERYGDRHPEMLKAQRQLADIDGQIQAEIQRIISNLEAKAQVSRERAAAISGSLGGARGSLAANNRAMVRLNELQRTADASRTLYESYLGRYKETSSQEGTEQSDARIVSKAKIPTSPSSPKLARNLALGLLLAFGAGIGSAMAAELLDSGLATADDVERRLDKSYLGGIPLLSSVAEASDESPVNYVVTKPLSSFSEAFRNLRASLLYSRLDEAVKVVAVTSSLPGEGKTTTSICLGRAAAIQGSKVIVVDCDLRRQTVNRHLREEPVIGLLDVLSGETPWDQAIVRDPDTGAHFLPLAKSTFTPKDVFGTAAMERLLLELRAHYDLVILDTAPVLAVADTRILANKADAVLFLARWRKTPQHAIEAAFRLLDGTGAHLAGVALTHVDMKQQTKYGYGDPGYYYAEYKKYYVS